MLRERTSPFTKQSCFKVHLFSYVIDLHNKLTLLTVVKRSKIIFIVISILFLLLIIIASYDIAKQTTAPWQKSHMKKELEDL